ncbi:MAG: shikimate dehydrogenase [Pseudomonadota bacterium]|nr:shikimate dehydrogenase [Pseudomonadota bacterium]
MTMKLAAVVGWPVEHSLSPRLHSYWLSEYGISGAYIPLAVRREDFGRVIDAIGRAGFAGINVTIPHKEAAFALAHTLDDAAKAAGAVNLLVFGADGRLHGHNTDAAGLAAHLSATLGAEFLRGKSAVLIGTGGAARAGILALSDLGAAEIRILGRNEVRAKGLVQAFAGTVSAQLTPVLWSDWAKAAADAGLIVNATSAGMTGQAALDLNLDALPKAAAVCDIVYNPLLTPLLKDASTRGHKVVDGLGMLLHQAVPAFAAFYGVTPLVTPSLRAELEKALSHG